MLDTPINVTYPAADDLHLQIILGACRVSARPGEVEGWVAGVCHAPGDRRVPTIGTEDRTVTITEEEPFLKRVHGVFSGIPQYDLEFGKERPFALTIEAGASEFDLDLGSVPLKALTVRQGAGRFNLDFSTPNPQPMDLLEVSSGAAGIELENLSNANFTKMRLSGGAAGCELDFGGELLQEAEVAIDTGLSGVEIAVPGSTAAMIVAETTLGSVDVGDGFTKWEGGFLTEGGITRMTKAGMAGNKPFLTIRAGVRLGALQIRTT
jgi:hypothetical protein